MQYLSLNFHNIFLTPPSANDKIIFSVKKNKYEQFFCYILLKMYIRLRVTPRRIHMGCHMPVITGLEMLTWKDQELDDILGPRLCCATKWRIPLQSKTKIRQGKVCFDIILAIVEVWLNEECLLLNLTMKLLHAFNHFFTNISEVRGSMKNKVLRI